MPPTHWNQDPFDRSMDVPQDHIARRAKTLNAKVQRIQPPSYSRAIAVFAPTRLSQCPSSIRALLGTPQQARRVVRNHTIPPAHLRTGRHVYIAVVQILPNYVTQGTRYRSYLSLMPLNAKVRPPYACVFDKIERIIGLLEYSIAPEYFCPQIETHHSSPCQLARVLNFDSVSKEWHLKPSHRTY